MVEQTALQPCLVTQLLSQRLSLSVGVGKKTHFFLPFPLNIPPSGGYFWGWAEAADLLFHARARAWEVESRRRPSLANQLFYGPPIQTFKHPIMNTPQHYITPHHQTTMNSEGTSLRTPWSLPYQVTQVWVTKAYVWVCIHNLCYPLILRVPIYYSFGII